MEVACAFTTPRDFAIMRVVEASAEELLGPLNTVERKFAPQRLWSRGDRELIEHHPRVAVVGTRRPTDAGQQRTRKLVKQLVGQGAVVVSGLAEGIDTIAHTTAMALGGRTIAVIGTSLDDVFPRSNAQLQQKIAVEHLVISEFPPGSPVQRGNFPRRNRTMALLADLSIIIEAGEGSGTLSTGWETLRLGRPLFLLRSVVESGLAWPREMLDYGAMVLADFSEVVPLLPTSAHHDFSF
jgi:DNA processing protein